MNSEKGNYQENPEIKEFSNSNDGNQIIVESTSFNTSSVSPIVLVKSDTDVTRVIFEPVLVDNEHDQKKCLSGKIIYEKRSKRDVYPTDKLTPRNVKTGEIIEIPLNTTATLKLFQSLSRLYEIYSKDGILLGNASYKLMDNSLNALIETFKNDPSAARMLSDPDNFEVVKILLQLITRTDSLDTLANALRELQSNALIKLNENISIERLYRVISLIEENLDNDKESFWQDTVFEKNQWVLSQLFASPCTIFKEKAYVGGKSVENLRGNICDFLYQNKISNNVIIIEIKTPKTKIIQDKYRNTFSLSYEMSGAINQVINYKDSLMKAYNSLNSNGSKEFSAFNPKCVVVIGSISSLSSNQVACFENYRNCLNNIEIITYDEILTRLKDIRNVFLYDQPSDDINV